MKRTDCCTIEPDESSEVYKILTGTPLEIEIQMNRLAEKNWIEVKGITGGSLTLAVIISFYAKRSKETIEGFDG